MGLFGSVDRTDVIAIDTAMRQTETFQLSARQFSTLSGGEAQRVVLAMALAQEADYLLLDEPTVHLDLGQQWKFISRLFELRSTRKIGILAILHDLTLAGSGFDQVILMAGGRVAAFGSPSDVLTEHNISAAFEAPVNVWHDESGVRVALRDVSSISPEVRP
jgi:iron complex transport system ATP-binding protein